MKEIIRETFEDGKLPQGWLEEQSFTFEGGVMRSGAVGTLRLPVPGTAYEQLRIETEIEAPNGGIVTCGDGTITLVANLDEGRHRVVWCGPAELVSSRKKIEKKAGRRLITFDYSFGCVSAHVDGIELFSTKVPGLKAATGLLELWFSPGLLISRISVFAGEPQSKPLFSYPRRENKNFHLEVTVDFYDDLLTGPWDAAMFDRLFEEYQSWGVKRCHWIYYGTGEEGWMRDTPHLGDYPAKTIENVGEIFPAAVRAAHAHGIEIYGLLKPFDMGLAYSRGQNKGKRKGLQKIGGFVDWIADFPAQRRDLLMARRPDAWGPAKNKTFTRIDLVKENDGPASFSVADIELYISDDNVTYRPYEGPIIREEVIENYPAWESTPSGGRPTNQKRSSRVMRLRGLEIRSPFTALSVGPKKSSFTNNLIDLIHVFGEQGEERLLTYGFFPRKGQFELTENVSVSSPPTDFRQTGIEFDTVDGTPTAVFPGFDAIRAPYSLDAGEGLLAFARGKDSGPLAALSPSFPEAREWWLSWLKAALDAGADGLELRVRNHHSPVAWGEYGFEKPVRDEFLNRHGVDLWTTDDFDKAAWRRLRGESYTEFCRQAKKLAQSYGKPLGIHVSPTNNMEPEQGGAMEIHWDWRTWIDEGLADSITLKEVFPGSRFAQEIFSHARGNGKEIPVIFSPYANDIWLRPGGEKICADWIRLARENDCDGFQFYESAAVVLGAKGGGLVMKQPALRKLFQSSFKNL